MPAPLGESRAWAEETFHLIWNEKRIGTIYDRYLHNVRIYRAMGSMSYGRDQLVADAVSFLACFSESEFQPGETVVSRESPDAFRSSTRWRMHVRHTGGGLYGAATGREAEFSGISHCTVVGDRIVEQWLEWDERALLRQLGIDESTHVQSLLAEPSRLCRPNLSVIGDLEQVSGQTAPSRPSAPKAAEFDVCEFLLGLYASIWNWRELGLLDRYYAEGCRVHGPGAETIEGAEKLKGYILSLLAPFPDAVLYIDDCFWDQGAQGGLRTAVRWLLAASHRNPGRFGAPTGKQVLLTGLTRHLLDQEKIVEEWLEFGELQLAGQLQGSRLRQTIGGESKHE